MRLVFCGAGQNAGFLTFIPHCEIICLSRLCLKDLFHSFYHFRVDSFLGARRANGSVLKRATGNYVRILNYVIRINAYCISAIFHAFRLYLRFRRVLVYFRIQVIFYSNGRFARNKDRHALYFLVFDRLFQDGIYHVRFSLDNFTTNFCCAFRYFLLIHNVSFRNVRRIQGRINATLMLNFCIQPLSTSVFIRNCRSIVTNCAPGNRGDCGGSGSGN